MNLKSKIGTVPPLSNLIYEGLAQNSEVMWRRGDLVISRPEATRMLASSEELLRTKNLCAGQRMAIHGAPDPETLSILLGCLMEGIIIIPIDENLPATRKEQMLDLVTPDAVFDPSGTLNLPSKLCVFNPDADRVAEINSFRREIPENAPCYIFFTSGTTGFPKAVVGCRDSLAHFILWEMGMLQIVSSDRVSILTRFSFDVVLRDILLPVASGAVAVIPDKNVVMTATNTMQWLKDEEITVTHIVPSIAQAMLSAGNDDTVPSLRHTLFAGEPLCSTLVDRWRVQFPQTQVHNLYGPTETTLAKFHAIVPTPSAEGIQSCGYPLPDTDVQIINPDQVAVPDGVLGEVAICTPFASLGYLDQLGKITSIQSKINGENYYLTGDLGFIDKTGSLHLRGRKDDQVKIMGVRLELAEIISVLQSFPGIAMATVVAHQHSDQQKYLVGFYVLDTKCDIAPNRIRAYMSGYLPVAGVPSFLIPCDAMPITPNGKIDKKRLPQPPFDCPIYMATEPGLESDIADAIAKELDVGQVGAMDDFFSLGGDSLAATGVCIRIYDTTGINVEPSIFLDAPTPRDLAQMLRDRGTRDINKIPAAPDSHIFPLSPQQKRYFRTFCAGGNRNWCNMVALLSLPDGVSVINVQNAIEDIALHHDSLRLCFEFDAHGNIVQSINPSAVFNLKKRDLSTLPENEIEKHLSRLKIEEGAVPIPVLSNTVCFRATILFLPANGRKLLWNVHHLISDGTSQNILAGLLYEWLANKVGFRSVNMTIPSFKDIAYFLQAQHQNQGGGGGEFFSKMLCTPKPYRHIYLPATHAVDEPQRCNAYVRSIRSEIFKDLRTRAMTLKCSPYILLVTGCFRALAKLSGSNDICIVTPLAGRSHPVISQIIGDFINLVALRIPDVSNQALVHNVRTLVADAARHQLFQFDDVLDLLDIPFDQDKNSLTGFSLNFMPQGDSGEIITGIHSDRGYKLKYDLLFLIRNYDNVINIEIQYRAGLFDQAGIETVFDTYENELN